MTHFKPAPTSFTRRHAIAALLAATAETGELALSVHAATTHLKRADMRLEQKKLRLDGKS